MAKAATPFAVYLSVGTTDFNYDEVQGLNSRLDGFGIRHHLQPFDGPHSWPPESVCADAITWLQLQAMRDGRLAKNTRWIDSLFAATAAGVDTIARSNPYAASIRYRQLAADFAGLHDTVSAAALATKLAESDAAKRTARRIASLSSDNQSALVREESFFSAFSQARSPAPLEKLRSQLDLDELRDRARQTADTLGAFAARRLLASISVRASFYEPRRYLAQADTLKALSMYALAQSINPEDGQLCAERDRLYRLFALKKSVPRELSCDPPH